MTESIINTTSATNNVNVASILGTTVAETLDPNGQFTIFSKILSKKGVSYLQKLIVQLRRGVESVPGRSRCARGVQGSEPGLGPAIGAVVFRSGPGDELALVVEEVLPLARAVHGRDRGPRGGGVRQVQRVADVHCGSGSILDVLSGKVSRILNMSFKL